MLYNMHVNVHLLIEYTYTRIKIGFLHYRSIESGLKPIWGTNVDCRINTDSPFNTTSCSSSSPGGYAACSPADGFAAARCGMCINNYVFIASSCTSI